MSAGETVLGLVFFIGFIAIGICIIVCIWRCIWRCLQDCCDDSADRRRRQYYNNRVHVSTTRAATPSAPQPASVDNNHDIEAATISAAPAIRDISIEDTRRDPPTNPDYVDTDHVPVFATIMINDDKIYADFGQGQLAIVEEAACSICLEDYNIDEIIWTSPNCRHVFHSHCIHEIRESENAVCPICRTQL